MFRVHPIQASSLHFLFSLVLLRCVQDFDRLIYVTEEPLLKWTSGDFIPNSVHLRRGEHDLKDQNQHFRGRTSMKPDALETRDFSLNLKKPNISDKGYYTCSIFDGTEELTGMGVEEGERHEVKDRGSESNPSRPRRGLSSLYMGCATYLLCHQGSN
uniref:Immunoglobulin V-set domain-containing protein n=1 Tax=Fundulus heteroclitus TaxID=8078 RepID=A0A3Q2P928_FUNHE